MTRAGQLSDGKWKHTMNCTHRGRAPPLAGHTTPWSALQGPILLGPLWTGAAHGYRVHAHRELGKIPSGKVPKGLPEPQHVRKRDSESWNQTHREALHPQRGCCLCGPSDSCPFSFFRNSHLLSCTVASLDMFPSICIFQSHAVTVRNQNSQMSQDGTGGLRSWPRGWGQESSPRRVSTLHKEVLQKPEKASEMMTFSRFPICPPEHGSPVIVTRAVFRVFLLPPNASLGFL